MSNLSSKQPTTPPNRQDYVWGEQYLEPQKTKINGLISVVTDEQEVARLREKILQHAKENIRTETAALEKDIAKRYRNGDSSVLPAILAVLKGNNQQEKNLLYHGLEKPYSNQYNDYKITHQELIDQIFIGFNNDADEDAAVQLAGFNDLPGAREKMEARILSGKSTVTGRIFYWLAKKGKPSPAIDHVLTLVRQKQVKGKELDQIINGLEDYAKHGNEAIRKVVGEMGLFIYEQKMIAAERFEDLKRSSYTSDAAETVLTIIFRYGDERVIPIANDIMKRKIRTRSPMQAFIRLEGAQHLETVRHFLSSKESFFTGLDIVEDMPSQYINNKLLEDVLRGFSSQADPKDYVADRIVRLFIKHNATDYLINIGAYISDPTARALIIKAYQQQRISNDEVLDDLLSYGLLDKRPSSDIIKNAASDSDSSFSFAIGVLAASECFVHFDTEADCIPVPFDELLYEFSASSQGLLKDMLVLMDAKKANNEYEYTLTIVHGNKAYLAYPQYYDDWYDVSAIETILNTLLDAAGTPKRFIQIDGGDQIAQYILGEPEKVQAFLKKYA